MAGKATPPALPRGWPRRVKAAVLMVMSMLRAAFDVEVARRLDGSVPAARDAAELARLRAENDTLKDELRVLRARFGRLKGPNRPRYSGPERLEILELKARCGWTAKETARRFLLDEETVAGWTSKVAEEGKDALLRVEPPVNKFPDLVDRIITRACGALPLPTKRKIATFLARVGLHVSPTTIWRRLKRPEATGPAPATAAESPSDTSGVPPRTVTAKYPGHVWSIDLTVVPTGGGFWSALGQVFPQVWPFCWWVAVAEDMFSRLVVGFAVFRKQPTSEEVRAFLDRARRASGKGPKHTVTDRGPQFDCEAFRSWCKRRRVKPRYGAVGRYGSIAVIERFIRTLKDECFRLIRVPMRLAEMRTETGLFVGWYNRDRPCQSLRSRTPEEVWFDREPGCEKPRWEPRLKWPRSSLCAAPQAPVNGPPRRSCRPRGQLCGGSDTSPRPQAAQVGLNPSRPRIHGAPRPARGRGQSAFSPPPILCAHHLSPPALSRGAGPLQAPGIRRLHAPPIHRTGSRQHRTSRAGSLGFDVRLIERFLDGVPEPRRVVAGL